MKFKPAINQVTKEWSVECYDTDVVFLPAEMCYIPDVADYHSAEKLARALDAAFNAGRDSMSYDIRQLIGVSDESGS